MNRMIIYNLIVDIIYFIFVVNDLHSKSKNFCMFKVCFSSRVHRSEETGNGGWPKRRMRLLIFLGCKGMENPNFWGRDWHPPGHLGIFFFLTSVFIFCNLSPLVMRVVEAIFWTILTTKSHLVYYEVTHSTIFSQNCSKMQTYILKID